MMEKKFKLNAAMINKNRAFLLLAIVLFCGLFVDNFYTAYNIRAVTGNGSLVIWLGLGFTIALTLLGGVREFLGTGKLFNIAIMPEDYGMLIFVLAPGAFIVLGYLIAIVNRLKKA